MTAAYHPHVLVQDMVESLPVWKRCGEVLRQLDYRVHIITDDDSLADGLRIQNPDMILMGLSPAVLPAVRLVHQHDGPLRIPIFIVADTINIDHLSELIDAGVDDCLRTGTPDALIRSRIVSAVKAKMSQNFALRVAKETPIRDPLTGLWNHRQFQELLRVELKRAERTYSPVSLLMMDLDYFKRLNDAYGHQAGDLCLRELAATMRREVRAGDVVARYGGEEFALVLPDTDRATALRIARRLQVAVRAHRVPVGVKREASMALSVGVAVYPEDAADASALVRASDMALYQAKRSGRDRVESVRHCRFAIELPGECAAIGVGGDWNAWAPEESPLNPGEPAGGQRIWENSLLLPTGKNRYKFKIRFLDRDEDRLRWQPDASNPLGEADGFGGHNSLVIVPPYEVPEDPLEQSV